MLQFDWWIQWAGIVRATINFNTNNNQEALSHWLIEANNWPIGMSNVNVLSLSSTNKMFFLSDAMLKDKAKKKCQSFKFVGQKGSQMDSLFDKEKSTNASN